MEINDYIIQIGIGIVISVIIGILGWCRVAIWRWSKKLYGWTTAVPRWMGRKTWGTVTWPFRLFRKKPEPDKESLWTERNGPDYNKAIKDHLKDKFEPGDFIKIGSRETFESVIISQPSAETLLREARQRQAEKTAAMEAQKLGILKADSYEALGRQRREAKRGITFEMGEYHSPAFFKCRKCRQEWTSIRANGGGVGVFLGPIAPCKKCSIKAAKVRSDVDWVPAEMVKGEQG